MIEIKQKNLKSRPEITNGLTPEKYFAEFIFHRVNLCPLPKINSLNTTLKFDIEGDHGGSWTILVESGFLKRVVKESLDTGTASNESGLKPSSTFRMNSETFMSILKREVTPQQAFFKKKVKIQGDIMIALKMNVLVNYL